MDSNEDRRLWIGNLDARITEYQLLKIVQKYGKIEKFDLLFHRNGPLAGQPRGYAFITYTTKDEAIEAKKILNNQQIGQKNVTVTWAHSMIESEIDKPRTEVKIPALAMSKNEKKTDRELQIQAIEAKLKMMENKRQDDELKINETVATKPPVIQQFQYNKTNTNVNNSNTTSNNNSPKIRSNPIKKPEKLLKPYSRHKSRR